MPLYLCTVVESYVSTEEKNLELQGSHNSILKLVMKYNISAYSKTPHNEPFTLIKLTKEFPISPKKLPTQEEVLDPSPMECKILSQCHTSFGPL